LTELPYENPWYFEGSPFLSEDIDDHFGFVYLITNLSSGRKYVGRKVFWFRRKPPGGKRKVKKESDWKKYYGSSDELKADVKALGKENFRREIISLHKTLGKTNFAETEALFKYNVLREKMEDGSPLYYNHNILGRYYRKDNFDK